MIIGVLCGFGNCEYEITWKELKEELNKEEWQSNCGVFTLNDYMDGRKSTNLQRFYYDPYTGQEIPWKLYKKEAKAIESKENK